MDYVLGMDISRHQVTEGGRFDFQKSVQAGVKFVYLRATIGDYGLDRDFEANYQGACEAGLLVGAYHVVAPADANGRIITGPEQAEAFLRTIAGKTFHLPHIVDCELTRNIDRKGVTAAVQSCLLQIPTVNDRPPGIYTRQSWWDANILPWSQWRTYPLFAARYFDDPISMPDSPWGDGFYRFRDWDHWHLWQWSADKNDRGAEFGAQSRSIDLDYFNGTYEQFLEWAGLQQPAAVIAGDGQSPARQPDERVTPPESVPIPPRPPRQPTHPSTPEPVPAPELTLLALEQLLLKHPNLSLTLNLDARLSGTGEGGALSLKELSELLEKHPNITVHVHLEGRAQEG